LILTYIVKILRFSINNLYGQNAENFNIGVYKPMYIHTVNYRCQEACKIKLLCQ